MSDEPGRAPGRTGDTDERMFPGQRDSGVALAPTSTGPTGPEVEAVAGLLRALHGYVTRNLPAHPALGTVVAALYAPVQAYAAGNVGLAKAQAIGAYELITRLRAADPALPVP